LTPVLPDASVIGRRTVAAAASTARAASAPSMATRLRPQALVPVSSGRAAVSVSGTAMPASARDW
jgi:hypothetical protein